MYTSNAFSRTMDQIERKRSSLSMGDVFQKIKQSFQAEMRDMPDKLNLELFRYYLGSFGSDETISDQMLERANRLGDVIDLFHGSYNDQNEDLPREDWVFIRDLASDYADEMDMDAVTSIMSQVMTRKYL